MHLPLSLILPWLPLFFFPVPYTRTTHPSSCHPPGVAFSPFLPTDQNIRSHNHRRIHLSDSPKLGFFTHTCLYNCTCFHPHLLFCPLLSSASTPSFTLSCNIPLTLPGTCPLVHHRHRCCCCCTCGKEDCLSLCMTSGTFCLSLGKWLPNVKNDSNTLK